MAKLEDIDAKLDYLEITKALIKEAIENKGQEIEETDTFREFVNKISNIQTKSNFHHLVVGTTNYNIQVDDTLTFGATLGTYKVNDYDWQYDTETTGGQDGFVGSCGYYAKKIQICIE